MHANHTPTRNVHSLIGAPGVPITSFPTDGAYRAPAVWRSPALDGSRPPACTGWGYGPLSPNATIGAVGRHHGSAAR